MQIGWIDFSPEERSRTLTVLSSLSEPGSVDELGVGIVRDAMADVLFPGTSTLLTKARYFFFVPYVSRYLEEGHDSARQDPRALRTTFRDLERRCKLVRPLVCGHSYFSAVEVILCSNERMVGCCYV